jgi:hypothetical protein
MTHALLTLLAPPELEERLADWLLTREDAPGFTTFASYGRGRDHGRATQATRVMDGGRRVCVVFQLVLPLDDAQDLVAALAEDLGSAELHYRVQPVWESGPVTIGRQRIAH